MVPTIIETTDGVEFVLISYDEFTPDELAEFTRLTAAQFRGLIAESNKFSVRAA